MSHNLYLVISTGMPRDHHALFNSTQPDGSGQIYQVTGNIQVGMTYETKLEVKPEESTTSPFLSKTLLGVVSAENVGRLDEECRKVPVPGKQFNGPKRLDPKVPLRRCQEWAQDAIEQLKASGVLAPA